MSRTAGTGYRAATDARQLGRLLITGASHHLYACRAEHVNYSVPRRQLETLPAQTSLVSVS